MASYQHLLQHSNLRGESPAKIFAKLKSKVQREGVCGQDGTRTRNEPLCYVQRNQTTESTRMEGDLQENRMFGSRDEAKALTISPISSPRKNLGCWNSQDTLLDNEHLVSGTGHGCTPRKGAFLESTAVPQPQSLVNRKQNHVESALFRHLDVFNAGNKMSTSVFSPMRNRLRKRKCGPWDCHDISSSTKIHNDTGSHCPENKTYVVMEDLVQRPRFSAVTHFPQEPSMPPPRSMAKKNCIVLLEKCPPLSPAKIFEFMKRESQSGHRDIQRVFNSRRNVFDKSEVHQSGDTPPPEDHTMHEDTLAASDEDTVVPVCEPSAEMTECRSSKDSSEDVSVPAAPSHPVLFEDPLILNSPRICIPKRKETTLKHNFTKPSEIPSECVIHLKNWFVRHNEKGLYVEGIHREEGIAWHSNIITERVSHYVVKTITGRVYILVGRMNMHVDSDFPRVFLKKFINGFPLNWKEMYERCLSESGIKDTERRNKGRGKTAKSTASINLSVKSQRRTVSRTPDACPPSSSSSTTVSRSGRVIKTPLEYWKGGRVILDGHMNVTIFDCYNTSICFPEKPAAVPARNVKKSSLAEPLGDKAATPPQRSVKAPPRRRNKAKENCGDRPPEASLSICEESVSRPTRSSQRSQTLRMDADPQPNAEKSSTAKSERRTSKRKRAVPPSRLSPDIDDKSPEQPSHNTIKVRTTKQSHMEHRKRAKVSPRLQTLEESSKEVRRREREEKNQESNKSKRISEPTNIKASTSSKKAKIHKGRMQIFPEQDEDKWTEEELAMLKEAVALYPKHRANYWAKVARFVGTRSPEECHNQHTFQGTSQSPVTRSRKGKKKQQEAPKGPDNPIISAGVGTFKRKQQVRRFLETMPKENVDDVFSCSYMQSKRFEIPTTYASSMSDEHDTMLGDLEPVTPMSAGFPEVKTPQCLYITPGMMGSPNRSNDDKYVFHLQKRMKQRQFNVCKQAPSKRSFTPTPSAKRTMKRCGNAGQDSYVVWDMFPGNEKALSDSGEEEDYYFSDND